MVIPPPPSSTPVLSASRGLPLAEAVRIILEDVLKKPFVLSSELVADTRSVAVSSKLDTKTAERVLDKILTDAGYLIERTSALYSVKQAPPPERADATPPASAWLTYRPRNRPVSYFASALPQLFPDAKFSFDKSSNSSTAPDVFFASLPPADRSHFLSVLESLDSPVARVQLRAALFETTEDAREGSGIKLAASLLSSRLGIALESQASGQTLTLKTPSIELALSALAADSRFKTLALPVLNLEHGSKGDFRVGTRIPLQKVTTTDGTTTTTVEYQDVGTLLSVLPLVSGQTVTTDISLELSDTAQTAVGTATAPSILTRNLKLRTALESGTAVLLGNLRSERQDSSDTGLFGFSLGSQRSQTKTDLFLLLYAEIIPAAADSASPGK